MENTGTTLIFGIDESDEQAFANLNVNRDTRSAQKADEIVVRELVQNAFDANARRVRFDLVKVPVERIPHIEQYRQTFNAAREERYPREPPAGRQVIDRIENALNANGGGLPCLVCSDDGDGLSGGAGALRAFYGSGLSSKAEGGRGSVGHGHFTAFIPSDLRYVLYASRCQDGSEVFGGRAILASHSEGDKPRGANGLIRLASQAGRFVLPQSLRGGDRIPDVLRGSIPDETGTAVMLLGYNPLSKRTREDLIGMILSASSCHFMVGIFDGKLRLSARDNGAEKHLSNAAGLKAALRPLSDREQKKHMRTLRTLETGTRLHEEAPGLLDSGVRVWFRKSLEEYESGTKRIVVFRDGMWIGYNTPSSLAASHFSGKRPFDAVVDLASDQPGSFGSLAREAEGASHLEIRPLEITDTDKQKKLYQCLRKLRDVLRSQAESTDEARVYKPDQLRLPVGGFRRSLPKRRPRRHDPDPDGHETASEEHTSQTAQTQRQRGTGADAHAPAGETPSTTPQTGSGSSGLATSCRAVPGRAGVFAVTWKGEFRHGAAWLRMLLPSGTDSSSPRQVKPEGLPIAGVELSAGSGSNARMSLQEGGAGRSAPPWLLRTPRNEHSSTGSAEVTIERKRADAFSAVELVLVQAELVHSRPVFEQP